MTVQLDVKVAGVSSGPVVISGAGEDRRAEPNQTVTMEIPEGGTLSVRQADPPKDSTAVLTGDIRDGHNNPNGITRAEIAPKMPKSSGELMQVVEGGRIVERAVADIGQATQGGGPESKRGETPGPQPSAAGTESGTPLVHGAATGDVKGNKTGLDPRTSGSKARTKASAKAPAKKSSRR